uniref:Major facilitator superfamily (MFS) profile domain-containing protein n=1 Tax=Bionectria ochroleuca TaxID=29856 RepID=A0A0B7KI15_BIOOC
MTSQSPKNNDNSSLSLDEESGLQTAPKTPALAIRDLSEYEDLSKDLRNDPELRKEFLATFTAEEEKAIMRKVDNRFLILIGFMFMSKNIDFSNVSIIKTMQAGTPNNIMAELGFTPDAYNWVGTIQGIPYIIFELPSNLLLKWMTPHSMESRIFLTWGIATACCAAVQTTGQLLACRWLVGMFEAGMFPGVITTLSYWYRTDEVGRPILWFFWISQFSTIVGSLICYGASYMDGLRALSGWRWAFILEGVATIIFAGIIFFLLPDFPKSPRSSKWLTPREQQFIEARLPPNAPATGDPSWKTKDAWMAFKSPTTWAFLFDQTLMNLSLYALNWYMPTIIAGLGFAKLPASLLLNIPPAFAAILAMVLCVLVTSRALAPRPLLCVLVVLGSIICYILFFTVSGSGGLYAACILSQFFTSSYYVPYWSWRTSIMSGSTGAAFAIGLQSSVAQLGAAIGPQFFQQKWASDRYRNSFLIGTAITLAALVTNLWTWWLTRDIERRVNEVRKATLKARREGRAYTGNEDIDVLGDRKVKNNSWW